MSTRVQFSLVLIVAATFISLFPLAADGASYITGVTPVDTIEVAFATPYEESMAKLPKTTTITLSEGDPVPVNLKWTLDQSYFRHTYGNYTAIGTFELPEGISQSSPETPLEVKTTLRMSSGRDLMVLNWEGFNQPGRYVAETMDLGDGQGRRMFYYYVPSSYDGSKPVPLLFDLHGGGSNGLAQWSSSRSDRLSEREGFIVVAPNGFPPAFVSAIIDKMNEMFNIDTRRVYAMGVSMGGMGSTTLALELSDRIAGIGIISGHMGLTRHAQNKQDLPRSMPMVLFGGTKESTRGAPFRDIVPSMLEAAKWLAVQNQCNPEPKVTEIPAKPEYLDLDDLPLWTTKEDALMIQKHYPISVTRYVWSEGINGHEIAAYAIHGGGHVWPGGNQYVVETTVGPVTHLIDATQLTWEHLKKFSLPEN